MDCNLYYTTLPELYITSIYNKGRNTVQTHLYNMISILFEYCEEYNKIPSQTTIYKNQKIGKWLQTKNNK